MKIIYNPRKELLTMKKLTFILSFCLLSSMAWSQANDPQLGAPSISTNGNGYLFDVIIHANSNQITDNDEVIGARIEVYNNTTDETEMLLENHNASNFQVQLNKGNHYSVLVRKEGYFNKRMEAYVDIKDCILCFDGLGNVESSVSDAMTDNQNSGALLANINLDKIEMNKVIKMENIYYDYDKWDIRKDAAKELDKVVAVLNEHPGILMELGSHTCSKGNDVYNLTLSEKRAKAAVEYIVTKGINNQRISFKGYGETALTNGCKNGVQCSERSHQKNRRTELKVTGIMDVGHIEYESLQDIVMKEREGNVRMMSKNN